MATRLQWLESSAPAAPPRLQWLESSADGALPTTLKLQWLESSATAGAVAPVLAPLADALVGPGQPMSLTASPLYGVTPDSYTWRRISGPAVTLSGSGASITFPGPSIMPPSLTPLVIGVTAVKGGVVSPEVTSTITILPQLAWSWTGTTWVGARTVPA